RGVVTEVQERQRSVERLGRLCGHRLRRQRADLVVPAGQPVYERLRVPAAVRLRWCPTERLLKRLAAHADIRVGQAGDQRAGRAWNVALELGEAANRLLSDARNRVLQAGDDLLVVAQE